MKILAFVDTHGSSDAIRKVKEKAKKNDVDLLICAGDVSVFEQNLEKILKDLDSLNKPVLIIPGNHESEARLKLLCSKFKNMVYIHKGMLRLKGYVFIGFAGNGFSTTDTEFRAWSNKVRGELKKKDNVILITHAPPHRTKLDRIMGNYCGNKDIRQFIEKVDILLAISGHLHENAGKEDMIKKTRVVNPGPYGMVIEI
ncbi:hypothetical protein COV19_07760 [Candidatus Woesearchaeota archaeon CG10_big_fil_rev_8_21_14_0_10_44_13]|nr:MAG: hypothetical protein COV19_07760 [Candidatus Woesearchaeota archaeon CG10_big_fil_rev_8_21_14_0_10_44_13]